MALNFGKIATNVIGQGLGMALGAVNKKGQLNQQKKLTQQQIDAQKELNDHQLANQMKLWENTNYSAQVEQAKKAGMSISALYGGSGAGGATAAAGTGGSVTGGVAEGASTTQMSEIARGMSLAQMENIKADTMKKEAETKAIEPGIENTIENTANIKWNRELSQKLNSDTFIKDIQDEQKWAAEKIDNENTKWKADWEAYQAGAFDGKQWDDKSTPMAKAIKAGFEQAVQTLENSKKTGDVLNAEKTIKQFEASLTRQGIAAGSPWYVKIVGDLLSKIGINLTGDTAKGAKTAKQIITN